jgi:hypothetical protein
MKIKIEICCDNAAFEGDPATEVKRILDRLTLRLMVNGLEDSALADVNGNRVGFLEVEE